MDGEGTYSRKRAPGPRKAPLGRYRTYAGSGLPGGRQGRSSRRVIVIYLPLRLPEHSGDFLRVQLPERGGVQELVEHRRDALHERIDRARTEILPIYWLAAGDDVLGDRKEVRVSEITARAGRGIRR